MIALASATVTGLFAIYYIPVGSSEERAATVLSKTGPQGQAAYRDAWSDGRLTRADMYEIRDASGHDIDNWVDMSGRTS
ncbi:hypothetical protein [Sphingomonas lacusdianchii]|uniref:hypothetical protein n=1 Tax=Sphingomonas lacusdianchii TaxID=2917992 RepID=UPI001F56EA76|nr:hypothetical protein [Sphingomonas sp. JXJ CY 53]